MDSLDFFRQLTRGARFTKRDAKSPALPIPTKRLKREEELKEDSIGSSENDNLSDVEETGSSTRHEKNTKQESEDEPEFEFLDGVAPTKKNSKKKAPKVDREQQLEQEMINILRKEKRITVHGKNLPPPIMSFEELQTQYNVNEKLVKNLLACKYPEPTPIQMQAMPILLKGRPLLACAPTGSGKTVAFLAPIINDLRAPQKVGFRAIVLAPTRELAQQIYRECVRLSEKTALHIHFISKISQVKQKIGPESSHKCDILISTPNRIRYLLQQEPPMLDLKSVEWFVLDEADRLMEEGQNNFKEQLDDILAACTNPNKKLALFSATYTVPVAKWALKNLKNLARVTVGHHNAATETVEQELRFVGSESGKLLEIRNLVHEGLKPPVLVFVQSKDRAKQLFEELILDGVNVDIIHADRTQQQRDNCVRAFREGHIWVLICTELMGRGIDFKGVNLVINFDFPPSIISYIHRIGRTGRAGRPGRAITFYTQNDMQYLRSIAQIVKNSGGKVPEHMLFMKKLRKTETKRLANFAVKREDISTEYKPIPAKQEKYEKFLNKQKAKKDFEENTADGKQPQPKQQRAKFNGHKKKGSTAAGRVTKQGKVKKRNVKSKVKQ